VKASAQHISVYFTQKELVSSDDMEFEEHHELLKLSLTVLLGAPL
jgi:hypothetical protein